MTEKNDVLAVMLCITPWLFDQNELFRD